MGVRGAKTKVFPVCSSYIVSLSHQSRYALSALGFYYATLADDIIITKCQKTNVVRVSQRVVQEVMSWIWLKYFTSVLNFILNSSEGYSPRCVWDILEICNHV